MDDEDRYGPVLHETWFGDTVDQDLLSDYRVIVLTVPESLAAGIRIRTSPPVISRMLTTSCLLSMAMWEPSHTQLSSARDMRPALSSEAVLEPDSAMATVERVFSTICVYRR